MKLSEVMKDSKIKIHATINGHGILLITKAAIGVRDGLLVDSLTYFDDDITFREPTKIVAVNKRDGRSYEFESQSIGPVETRYGKFHLIRCPEEGTAINRRKSERYDIDRLGVIRINSGGDMRNALVYDISMKGISLILDSDAICKIGDHISASFRYDPNDFHFYGCEATVVRTFTINYQVALGCRIDSMGPDMITLISNRKKEADGITADGMLTAANAEGALEDANKKLQEAFTAPAPLPEHSSTTQASKAKAASDNKAESIQKKQPESVPDNTSKTGYLSSDDIESILGRDIGDPGEEDMQSDDQYLSAEDAADLIPERSPEEIKKARSMKYETRSDIYEMESPSDTYFEEEISAPEPAGTDSPLSHLREIERLDELDDIEDRSGTRPIDLKRLRESGADDFIPDSVYKGADPAKSLANAANAAKSSAHLTERSSLAVDKSLFSPGKGDGFLTPEQISDIIELERINKRKF